MMLSFRGKGILDASFIINHTCTCVVSGMTLYDYLNGQKPLISHFRNFGSSAWVHSPHGRHIISLAKYTLCEIMVGYESFFGGIIYNLVTHHVTKHHEAIFDEHVPYGPSRSFPSLLSIDDFSDCCQFVFKEHASSSSSST
jgi:hypothetical protein